jgi:OOP family OmpA-OmpF porin
LSPVRILLIFVSCLFAFKVFCQHSLQKLSYPVNTDYLDEICPVATFDEDILFFTRVADRHCEKTLYVDSFNVFSTFETNEYEQKLKQVYSQIASIPVDDPLSSGYNQDIWYTRLVNNMPQGIFHPEYPINDVLPNSICSNFGKSSTFLVINQFAPMGGIERGFSITKMENQEFTFPEPIEIQHFNKAASELNITSSLDSTVLILSMDDSQGMGDMDVYVCFRLGNNKYSLPINIGKDINTAYRESTPMLSHDMKRLYFTSDRPGGRGGKDIYYAERKDFTYTSWTTPMAFDPPVNSVYDDSHPHLLKNNNIFYFTSNRDGTSDIFQAKLLREKLQKEIIINVKIINGDTGKPMPGELIWGEAYKQERPGYFRSKDGVCRYKFFENKPVVFKAINRNLYSEEKIIDPQELINQNISEMTLELILYGDDRPVTQKVKENTEPQNIENGLSELELNRTILLNNIYFERTKAVVLPESYPTLQKLADVLLSRSRLYISIIGHTDNVGDKTALKTLSEDRAMSIKQVLIEKGVPDYRVNTIGYGDTRPIAPNDTEENKSKNRRVEIKVISQ